MTEPRTLLEVAVARGGILKGAKAAEVVVSWAVATRELGHELGQGEGVTAAVHEYRDYWKLSERTAWRELQRFKSVFGEETPARLARLLNAEADVRREQAHQLIAGVRLAV